VGSEKRVRLPGMQARHELHWKPSRPVLATPGAKLELHVYDSDPIEGDFAFGHEATSRSRWIAFDDSATTPARVAELGNASTASDTGQRKFTSPSSTSRHRSSTPTTSRRPLNPGRHGPAVRDARDGWIGRVRRSVAISRSLGRTVPGRRWLPEAAGKSRRGGLTRPTPCASSVIPRGCRERPRTPCALNWIAAIHSQWDAADRVVSVSLWSTLGADEPRRRERREWSSRARRAVR
jgi:hypothetical protein